MCGVLGVSCNGLLYFYPCGLSVGPSAEVRGVGLCEGGRARGARRRPSSTAVAVAAEGQGLVVLEVLVWVELKVVLLTNKARSSKVQKGGRGLESASPASRAPLELRAYTTLTPPPKRLSSWSGAMRSVITPLASSLAEITCRGLARRGCEG